MQLGYVRTVYEPRKTVQATYSERIARQFPGMMLAESFPKAVQFEEADAARAPITHWKPRSAAAKAVGRIADEMEAKIASQRAAPGR